MRILLRRLVGLLAVLPSVAVVSGSSASAATVEPTRRFLVTLVAGQDSKVEAQASLSRGEKVRHVYARVLNGFAVDLTAQQAAKLASRKGVASVVPDVPVRASVDQVSPPWGLDRLDQRSSSLSGAFSFPTSGGAGVRVYVVDTGVRASHVELAGRVAPGFNALADQNGTADCNGHGTHVAGTIAGTSFGVAKLATVVPVRVLDCFGSGSATSIIAGLDWIVANNSAPAVVNMSLGGGSMPALDAAVQRVIDAGIPVVVAAGNSGVDACGTSPAKVAAAVTVAATDVLDARPAWSNFGACVDVFAPGVSVVSAGYTNDFVSATLSGTSMASPHVAGVLALMRAASPLLTPVQLGSALVSQASVGVVTNAGVGSPNRLLFSPPVVTSGSEPLVLPFAGLPRALVGQSYLSQVYVAGGSPPYSFSALSPFPSGVSLNGSSGVVSGVPTAAGVSSVSVRVVDAAGRVASQSFVFTVEAPPAPLVFDPPVAPSATVGVPYSFTFQSSGGRAPFNWFFVSGGVAPGLVLDAATGTVSGVPTAAGSFSFAVEVVDSVGQWVMQYGSLSVAAGALPLAVSTVSVPSGTTGVAYSVSLAASGGLAPYVWSVSGVLPPGLVLSSGVVSGVPTLAGSWPVSLVVTDASGKSASAAVVFQVVAGVSKPGGFLKTSPAANATGQSSSPTLSWGVATGAVSYQVCVDKVNNNVCDGSWVSVGSLRSYRASLAAKTVYFWQVRAVNAGGFVEGNAGVWWKFTTK